MLRFFAAAAALLLLLVAPSHARPAVRTLRDDREFQRLIKHHKEVTGLPVVVDFFSESCGPCRMIAPHFKRMAKEYKDRAVFAKVDVNFNRETSSKQYIRSMPTFQFYMNGKKRHQFSGGDINQLQQWTQMLASDFERNNVEVTPETLKAFYAEQGATDKADDANVEKVLKKARKGGGAGFRSLVKALKSKYGVAPKLDKRYVAGAEETKKKQQKQQQQANVPLKPNLHLASIEELTVELEERREAEAEKRAEEEGSADDTNDAQLSWSPHPEGYAETIAIVGGGPAGLAASLYAARAGLKPVVIAPPVGGQLKGKGVQVENYPAVAGMTGPSLVYAMEEQAAQAGALFFFEEVVAVNLSARPFEITTAPQGSPASTLNSSVTAENAAAEAAPTLTTFKAHAIVVATGADSRWLGVEGEEALRGGGVSSCATCDGFLYRDMPVVVVGGGDTAMEEALVLARTSSSVTVIHRRNEFRASHVLAQRVLNHPKINVLWNTTVKRFEGVTAKIPTESGEEGEEEEILKLTTTVVDTTSPDGSVSTAELACDAAFVAIGHDPNTKIFESQLEMDPNGYLIAKGGATRTSVEGVFGAGDVVDHVYRQAITSAGTGAMAALDAERWLSEQGIKDEAAEAEAAFLRELMEDFAESEEETVNVEYVAYKDDSANDVPDAAKPVQPEPAAATQTTGHTEL